MYYGFSFCERLVFGLEDIINPFQVVGGTVHFRVVTVLSYVFVPDVVITFCVIPILTISPQQLLMPLCFN